MFFTSSWLVLLLLGLAAYGVVQLYRIITGDADLILASKLPPKDQDLKDKVVWVVGASQGLGESLSSQVALLGAKLILSSRRLDKLEALKTRLHEKLPSSKIVTLAFDITKTHDFAEVAKRADSAFQDGGVDYLIIAAGATQHAAAHETTREVAEEVLQLNAVGPILLGQAVLPVMLQRGKGRIVPIVSMAAKVPSPGQAMYAAGKGALYGYFATVNTELNRRGIGVTLCCPGPAGTGSEKKPRMVYGAKELTHETTQPGRSKRIAPERCAELIITAMFHELDECWIARHPVLTIGYLWSWLPNLGWWLLKSIGPKRVSSLTNGGGGYDVGSMLNADGSKRAELDG